MQKETCKDSIISNIKKFVPTAEKTSSIVFLLTPNTERTFMTNELVYTFPLALNTSVETHRFFAEFSLFLKTAKCKRLILNMSNVNFIASNQFAILGCLLESFLDVQPDSSISFYDLQPSIIEIVQKNGFYHHFIGMPSLPDKHNTVIPYKVFDVKEIKEYESYLTLKIFNRNDLPAMSISYRNKIQDYLLEVFKNVADHTTSTKVYTCGHFFPKRDLLFFTIVDSGETIPYNVNRYFHHTMQHVPENILQWALQEGTTTLTEKAPRGVGLYLIKDFIQKNHGKLYIVSGNESYVLSSNGERYHHLDCPFSGTIVTLAFKLNDKTRYILDSEDVEIQF